MNKKLRSVLAFAVLALVGVTAMLSLRVSAAPGASRLFLPVVRKDAVGQILPDLNPTYAYWNMRGYRGGCAPQYTELVIMVCLRNQGQVAAGPFNVSVNGAFGNRASGLAAGASTCVETISASMPVSIVVDSGNEVAESDESNNTWAGMIPMPTPPLLCTATPTATPTVRVTPSVTPSPTACLSIGSGAPDGIGGCPLSR